MRVIKFSYLTCSWTVVQMVQTVLTEAEPFCTAVHVHVILHTVYILYISSSQREVKWGISQLLIKSRKSPSWDLVDEPWLPKWNSGVAMDTGMKCQHWKSQINFWPWEHFVLKSSEWAPEMLRAAKNCTQVLLKVVLINTTWGLNDGLTSLKKCINFFLPNRLHYILK